VKKNAKWRLLRRSRSFKVIEVGTNWKPVCDFLLAINSNWHPSSYRFGVNNNIVQISDTLRFRATLWGLRNNVRCSSWAHWKARSGLAINVNWTFFARCYGWVATSEKRSKIGDFAPTRSLWSKISGQRGRSPPIIFARLVRPMNALQLCRWQFSHKKLSSSEVRFFYGNRPSCVFETTFGGLRGNVRWSS